IRKPLRKAFAPDLQRLSSEPEPGRAPLPEQQNGPMLARAAPSATLLIADFPSPRRSAPSRPPSFAPSCREIRRPKIRSRLDRVDQWPERIPPCAWYFVPLFCDLRQRRRDHVGLEIVWPLAPATPDQVGRGHATPRQSPAAAGPPGLCFGNGKLCPSPKIERESFARQIPL